MRKKIGLLCGLLAGLLVASPPLSARDITFQPSLQPLQNPERGFWRFAADDFAKVTAGDIQDIRDNGMTLAYAIVRLDDYRRRPLPASFLADLRTAFGKARKGGVKVILRFAYNYPQSSSDYENAKDAPLPVVLGHIRQLTPVIAANKDVIAVWQAGFIGAWGEGHTSSNHLDSFVNKTIIKDALLDALPSDRMLQWRYPPDLIRWSPIPPLPGSFGKLGIHNDCFLSSATDVGTYSEVPKIRTRQKVYAAVVSAATFFSGETCDAEPKHIRSSCGDILREGMLFHLSALGKDYYTAFHKRWKKEGCYPTVERSMGYRFELTGASAPETAVAGDRVLIEVGIRNGGWARLVNRRPLIVSLVNEATGKVIDLKSKDLRLIEPLAAAASLYSVNWRIPSNLPAGKYLVALSAPDASPRIARDQRFGVRFAVADVPAIGQVYETPTGRFRTGLSITISAP